MLRIFARMDWRGFCFVALLALSSCGGGAPAHFATHEGKTLDFDSLLGRHEATVLLFLAPECPLCESYAPLMRNWPEAWNSDSVAVLGVVSGKYYSPQQIGKYLRQHKLDFEVIIDPAFQLSKRYGARITPEVVLLNPGGEVHYQGAIDNWAISLGQKRLQATAHYLHDAVQQFLSGNEIEPKRTQAIGCFIE